MKPILSQVNKFWRRYSSALFAGATLILICFYFAFPSLDYAINDARDSNQNKCVPRTFDPHQICRPSSGVVKIIKLTNAGEFVDRCQLTDALEEMVWDRELLGQDALRKLGWETDRRDYKPPIKRTAENLPRLAILYIHGWKHSANEGDKDLTRFTALVHELRDKHKKKQVVGVYVGWNASWNLQRYYLGWLENFSFWSKKAVADRIAESAVVTKIISALGSSRNSNRGDQLIVIGHSFGARLLFAAAGQTLIYETQNAHPGSPLGIYRVVKSAADAIILLNPAFEASMYTALDSVTRNEERFSANQALLLISVASVADIPTQWFFPIGQWLGGARTEQEKTTLGNYMPYRSHSLEVSDGAACGAEGRISEAFFAKGLCLKRIFRPTKQTHNPFIVATTSAAIIPDHNKIWNQRFKDWLVALVRALEADHDASNRPSPNDRSYFPGRVCREQ